MSADYVYTRKDGSTIECYGEIEEDSSFELVHENEYLDGVAGDIDCEVYNTWHKVCKYLVEGYELRGPGHKLAQITAC